MSPSFHRLVRFKSPSGETFYGELGTDIEATRDSLIGLEVPVYGAISKLDDKPLTRDGRVETIQEVVGMSVSKGCRTN
jgi:hypothetical protein